MVRANRYALAAALAGKPLEPWVRALHGCNNLACVRVSLTDEIGLLHVVPGTQRDNMLMMARAGRGGGRVAIRRGDNGMKARRARAVALREAVRTFGPTTHFAQREQITRQPLLVADHPQDT